MQAGVAEAERRKIEADKIAEMHLHNRRFPNQKAAHEDQLVLEEGE